MERLLDHRGMDRQYFEEYEGQPPLASLPFLLLFAAASLLLAAWCVRFVQKIVKRGF